MIGLNVRRSLTFAALAAISLYVLGGLIMTAILQISGDENTVPNHVWSGPDWIAGVVAYGVTIATLWRILPPGRGSAAVVGLCSTMVYLTPPIIAAMWAGAGFGESLTGVYVASFLMFLNGWIAVGIAIGASFIFDRGQTSRKRWRQNVDRARVANVRTNYISSVDNEKRTK